MGWAVSDHGPGRCGPVMDYYEWLDENENSSWAQAQAIIYGKEF